MTEHLLRRSWLIALIAVCAGFVAWLIVHNDPKTYERTLAFAVLPSKDLEDQQISDALRALSDPNAGFTGTMASVIDSPRLLGQAVKSVVGAGPESLKYTVTAGARPGSDVLEARLQGPDPESLTKIGTSLSALTAAWVRDNYRAYRLELLSNRPSVGAVAPHTSRTTALAVLLAGLLALAFAYFEARALTGRSAATATAESRSERLRRTPPAESSTDVESGGPGEATDATPIAMPLERPRAQER